MKTLSSLVLRKWSVKISYESMNEGKITRKISGLFMWPHLLFVCCLQCVHCAERVYHHLRVTMTGQNQIKALPVAVFVLFFEFICRWFKFMLKPPYSIMHENFLSAIWDTSHWNFFVKFGLKTA